MNPELQWFIAAALENGEVTLKTTQELRTKLGDDSPMTTFAQEALNLRIKDMPEKEAGYTLSRFEQLMELATNNATTGELPSPELLGELPSIDGIDQMNNEQVCELMYSLLRCVRNMGASDLHLSAGAVPFIRLNLVIQRLGTRVLSPEDAMRLNTALLTDAQQASFIENKDLGFALEMGNGRFRVSLMIHKDGAAGSYRLVPSKIRKLEDLGFSSKNISTISKMLDYHNGLILVTGPLGSGKTSTLAAMVDIVNRKRYDHIIAVEDPIEIVQTSNNCNVTQREIGAHTNSYASALKGALREDPDVIVIGELHDLDTIEMAITASETGHLVIGTLHTCDAANTLNRLLDVFPPTQQPQIRAMTAGSLRGIICQRLVPTRDGGMTVAAEVLVNTMAVSNIIDEGKTHHLKAVMQTGASAGMCTMDSSLYDLYSKKLITAETAMTYIKDKGHYSKLIK